jgi:hypothetical protein
MQNKYQSFPPLERGTLALIGYGGRRVRVADGDMSAVMLPYHVDARLGTALLQRIAKSFLDTGKYKVSSTE